MLSSFHCTYPFFLLLLPLFALSALLFKREKESFYMPHFLQLLSHVKKRHYAGEILKWSMLTCMTVALSDPVVVKKIKARKSNAVDIVLALDTSGSMSTYGFNAKNYKQSRLDVVKEVVQSFIDMRKRDRIGLVIFGTTAAVASPLSFDKEAQKNIVGKIEVGVLGKSTALIDAVISAAELLKNSKSKSKVIILLSDGEDSASKIPLAFALKLARKYGIIIYTITIDKSYSNMMKVIANKNGAQNFEVQNKKDLLKVYKRIDMLQKSEFEYNTLDVEEHIYFYFLLLSLLCAILLLPHVKNKGVL
ncbi:VWA domain-containing protein [Sulfurimonas sp. SWIR-19]|uniref:vWA domain-containing protein n=1 Tax=Sulfurimonas sp. SWIR-19 TaxID=2878390 RepID=UPI001CF321AF|nr:VWA domain-containing protein [Sulfurimonas sp. SWIR-19]UCM99363.1 VWA domain-containing protein [Sulfurimonas sp. SWIR-19]